MHFNAYSSKYVTYIIKGYKHKIIHKMFTIFQNSQLTGFVICSWGMDMSNSLVEAILFTLTTIKKKKTDAKLLTIRKKL